MMNRSLVGTLALRLQALELELAEARRLGPAAERCVRQALEVTADRLDRELALELSRPVRERALRRAQSRAVRDLP